MRPGSSLGRQRKVPQRATLPLLGIRGSRDREPYGGVLGGRARDNVEPPLPRVCRRLEVDQEASAED